MLKLYQYEYIDMTSAKIDTRTEAEKSVYNIEQKLIRLGKKLLKIKKLD